MSGYFVPANQLLLSMKLCLNLDYFDPWMGPVLKQKEWVRPSLCHAEEQAQLHKGLKIWPIHKRGMITLPKVLPTPKKKRAADRAACLPSIINYVRHLGGVFN